MNEFSGGDRSSTKFKGDDLLRAEQIAEEHL